MALADGRSRPASLSSSSQDREINDQQNINIQHTPLLDQDRFVINGMVQHSPPEASRQNYNTVDYASKLDMDDDDNKAHLVGGGGGGATFIFKVHIRKRTNITIFVKYLESILVLYVIIGYERILL